MPEPEETMIEQLINIDRMEYAVALFGSFDENIRLIEQEYHVTVTCRGTEIKVFGEEQAVMLASRSGRYRRKSRRPFQ